MPRAVGRNRAKHLPPNQPSLGPGGAGTGKFCAGWPRPCPPPHAAFRTRCTRTVQRVRSEAHYAAAVPRLVQPASGGGPCKTGERAALPHWAEAEPGFPHVVRIRTDIFLRRGKCPGCRVRWGETERSISFKAALFFARAALRGGEVSRGVTAALSAAARGVSDTLPSSRAKCSLRGALRGGRAASGSACIGRRAGQNRGERRPAAPGRPLAFFGRGCTIPYRETCFLKERENANGTTGKRP